MSAHEQAGEVDLDVLRERAKFWTTRDPSTIGHLYDRSAVAFAGEVMYLLDHLERAEGAVAAGLALADEWERIGWKGQPHLGCLDMYRHCAAELWRALGHETRREAAESAARVEVAPGGHRGRERRSGGRNRHRQRDACGRDGERMSACKWAGRGNPRLVPGRHEDGCQGAYEPTSSHCPGCLPCTEPHCRVCGFTHHEGTCAECMADVRTNLREIARMCGALPEEVAHRGINGEAMMLLGPVADVERRQHTEASYLAGRLPEGWISAAHGKHCPILANEPCVGCAGDETHPLTILLSWQLVWRDALEHDEAPDSELTTAVDYLDRQMTYMGGYPHVPFEDFARDLRRCETHLSGVLHDQDRGVRANVPCFDCGADIERQLGKQGFDDHWTCLGCKRRYTISEYNIALRASLEDAQEDVQESA